MCGIVGYIGSKDVKQIIIDGLTRLEYRGYDSAGMAVVNEKGITLFREVGRIKNLEAILDQNCLAKTGIGHTRWATHGRPSVENSHPHTSMNAKFTIVHNGVIENYAKLKEELVAKGYTFNSQTDTEVVANLLEEEYKNTNDIAQSIRNMMKTVHGSYALGIICSDRPDTLYAAKNKSPMLIGIGEGFNMIGSDALAMISETNQFKEISDEEYLLINEKEVCIFDIEGNIVERPTFESNINANDIELGVYPHFMLKEIDEQPAVIRRLIQAYQNDQGQLVIPNEITQLIRACDRIYIIASGTSAHAGMIGKQLIEKLAGIPVEVHIGSEFGYNVPVLSAKPLFMFISQSGETADSRVPLKLLSEQGYPTLTITNVEGSTLSREADYTLLLHAGPEVAVASTKAYTAQVTLLAIIANALADKKIDLVKELSIAATAVETLINKKDRIKDLVEKNIISSRNCFYIGRVMDYYVALEAALKLKEISYIQTEGFAAGELKHGTIALIEEKVPVVALISQPDVALNTRSAVQEVQARGANVITIAMKSLANADDNIVFDECDPLLSPIVTVVATQLISYYAALLKGLDIDKPRNLAKSVTVE